MKHNNHMLSWPTATGTYALRAPADCGGGRIQNQNQGSIMSNIPSVVVKRLTSTVPKFKKVLMQAWGTKRPNLEFLG